MTSIPRRSPPPSRRRTESPTKQAKGSSLALTTPVFRSPRSGSSPTSVGQPSTRYSSVSRTPAIVGARPCRRLVVGPTPSPSPTPRNTGPGGGTWLVERCTKQQVGYLGLLETVLVELEGLRVLGDRADDVVRKPVLAIRADLEPHLDIGIHLPSQVLHDLVGDLARVA
jgi:hypothetical protein